MREHFKPWPTSYQQAANIWYFHHYGWCPDNCAAETNNGHQCSRHPGHGPSGLYCQQHANHFSGINHQNMNP